MNNFRIRPGTQSDRAGANYVCLKTGDYGQDGEPFYQDDPDALGRIFVEPYLEFAPQFSLMLEDSNGICGYSFGALDSHSFFDRYEREWRPQLCARFPHPAGDPSHWTRTQTVHSWYHHPDYFCPEPYAQYPSHLHIDLLEQARGHGFGRKMLDEVMRLLAQAGSPGAHLGVSALNQRALSFYLHLGFMELARVGQGNEGVIYLGKQFKPV